jgi:hypothetical protein
LSAVPLPLSQENLRDGSSRCLSCVLAIRFRFRRTYPRNACCARRIRSGSSLSRRFARCTRWKSDRLVMGQRPRPAEDAALDTSVSPCCASLTVDLPGLLRTWPQASSWITNSCAMDYRFPFPLVHAPGIDLACLFAPATYTIWPRLAPCAQFHPVNNDRCTILVSEMYHSNTGKLEVHAACTFRAGGDSP